MHPHKRLEDLLDAFRVALPKLPPTVLKIAGGADAGCDDYAEQLRRHSADLPVEWLGELSETFAFQDELEVFAMISEPAGCPNASLEAMAAGLPVVATDVGGASEQVVDHVTGRLVARRDVDAFAEALVQMGTCADCRTRLGDAGRKRVEERFSLERMTRDYQSLLTGAGATSNGG